MFNLQGSELIIILLLALVVLGPEKLPDAMRKLGALYAQLRKMSNSFQQEFKAAVDEPMREMRDTANVLRDSADFRKLQGGERSEKPKSAAMPPAFPTTVPTVPPVPTEPTVDVPFDPVAAVPPSASPPDATANAWAPPPPGARRDGAPPPPEAGA